LVDVCVIALGQTMAEQLFTLSGVFGVILFVFPPFLIMVPPLFLFYAGMQQKYRNATRELKRLTSISKSPIFSHFSETITYVITVVPVFKRMQTFGKACKRMQVNIRCMCSGLTCVRAYGEQTRFIETSDGNVDNNMRFQLVMMTAGRWMGFQLNFSAAVIVPPRRIRVEMSSQNHTTALIEMSVSSQVDCSQPSARN